MAVLAVVLPFHRSINSTTITRHNPSNNSRCFSSSIRIRPRVAAQQPQGSSKKDA